MRPWLHVEVLPLAAYACFGGADECIRERDLRMFAFTVCQGLTLMCFYMSHHGQLLRKTNQTDCDYLYMCLSCRHFIIPGCTVLCLTRALILVAYVHF